MTALRTPQSVGPARNRGWSQRARFAALLALPIALAGCGVETAPIGGAAPSSGLGTDDPAWVTNRTMMPAPDLDRLNYDERTRTLTLYGLSGNDRWMVRMPGAEVGRPAVAQQRIPTDAELSRVVVYYVRPGMKPSAPVSVKQIRDLGRAHNSLALLK